MDHRIVAVETGNMLGKGFLIGGLVPWFLWTRKHSLVYICGAGQTQIGSVLFKEIRRAVQNCPFWKAGLLPMTISPGIKSSPATATIRPGWGALGFSTSTIERASGHHARHMLVIVDEASGVPDESWQAIDSLGFSKMLVAGNPIRSDGKFATLCDQGDRDALEQRPPHLACRHFNVPSTASPHADLDRSPWGMADKTWLESFEVALFRRVWAQRGGFLLSADLGKIVVRKRTIRQPLKKEPPVLIMQDALPLFKSFLKPVSLKQRARQLVLRCVIAFLMHLGKMSASRVAGAVRTDARHRAQVSRFLGRRYWRRCDLLGQLRAQLLEMEARQGTFVFDIDQTYCSQQGKLTENTIIRGEKTKRPKKNKKKQKKYAQRSSHCFVMGLLITPSGMRLPFSVSYYTEAYCKAKKIAYRKQTELAAQLIRQLPLPPEARVVVLGDTAFDAKAIRTACEERKFSWIVPINPERVLAGEKPRPKVSSLSEDLTADQMVCLKVHPGKGKYVDYRRISRYRIGPKFKPRTYYVHEESRDVHSVGKVRLFFSTTKAPAQGHRVEVQKTLMTNDAKLILRDVIELYQLRWQIELFFKELKSTLGLHHYRFKKFEKAETWVTLCLVTFVYLEWIRAHKLKQKALKKKEREWWQTQRTYGLALAVRQEAEQRELKLLAEKMETPTGRKVLAKQLRQSHPKEYRAAI